jgi:hypothetical protein
MIAVKALLAEPSRILFQLQEAIKGIIILLS